MASSMYFIALLVAGIVHPLQSAHVSPAMSDDEMFGLNLDELEEENLSYIAIKAKATAGHYKQKSLDFDSFALKANQKLDERRKGVPARAPTTEQLDKSVQDGMQALLQVDKAETSSMFNAVVGGSAVAFLTVCALLLRTKPSEKPSSDKQPDVAALREKHLDKVAKGESSDKKD